MELDTEQYNRVIRFLDAEMSVTEMVDFESELDSNPALRQQLDFEQSIRDTLAYRNQEESQKVKVKELTLSKKTDDSKRKSIYVYLAVAASIIGIIAWSVLFNNSKVPSNTQLDKHHPIRKNIDSSFRKSTINTDKANGQIYVSLFKKYFSRDKSPENSPIMLAEALINYDKGNYVSIQLIDLSKIPEIRGEDTLNEKEHVLQLGHYYKGISYLETGDAKRAIENLEWVLKHSSNNEIIGKAEWYLALGYLRNKEKENAKDVLLVLIQNKNNKPFFQKGNELYYELNNFK